VYDDWVYQFDDNDTSSAAKRVETSILPLLNNNKTSRGHPLQQKNKRLNSDEIKGYPPPPGFKPIKNLTHLDFLHLINNSHYEFRISSTSAAFFILQGHPTLIDHHLALKSPPWVLEQLVLQRSHRSSSSRAPISYLHNK